MHPFKKIVLATWLIAICHYSFSQNTPQLIPQINFETGLDKVLSNKKQNTFLVISGDKYTLIDQTSKIQLGTLVFDAGSWGAQGVGKTVLWGDSNILISTAFVLMKADPITGRIDTFFNLIKYPEIIEGFIPLPYDENKILIHTKTYPLNKDSSISAIKVKNEHIEYLGAKNCKLYLYNNITRKVEKVITTPYLFTAFAPQLYNGALLAGTLGGDIIQIDAHLNQKKLFHASDTTIHSVLACGDYIAVIPALAHKYVTNTTGYGGESIHFFKNNKRKKIISFEKQKPNISEFSLVSPSATIFRAFYSETLNSVIVNYGFSRLVNISLSSFDTTHYPIPYNMAKFYCFGNDNERLLAAMDTRQNAFASASIQGLYDLENNKFLPAFKQYDKQVKYQQFYKLFDAQGNYHIIAYKRDYSSDSITIFSSNKTQPTVIACKWCKFTINAKNNLLAIKQYGAAKVLKLPFSKMQKSLYTINFNTPPKIFEQVFTTLNIDKEKKPSSVNEIHPLTPQNYLMVGTHFHKNKSKYSVSVINQKGEFVFEKKGLQKISTSHLVVISPSKKYIAISYKKGSKQRVEVWDWQANKKVFSKKLKKRNDLQHTTFDKTKDILWFSTQHWATSGYIITNIYAVDVTTKEPVAKFKFADDRYFSFAVDMQNNKVAFEAYNEIYVAQLSTQKILWHKTPKDNFFEVGHLPNGFSFSNKTELHTLQNDSNYLYFTTFGKDKFVEVANNYLYKGAKAAINNLAFVYQRKGFLPTDYDVYFNRPDTVLRLSGSTNNQYNTLITGAIGKRLRKHKTTNLNQLLTQSPSIEIINRNNIPYVVQSRSIQFKIKAKSKFRNLSTYHQLINGVPDLPIPLLDEDTSAIIVTALLHKGRNTIQFYVEDTKGIASPTVTLNIVAEYESTAPKTYFVGIGIDKFLDSSQNLNYAVKDIRDLVTALKAKIGDNLIVDTLFNEQVTVKNIVALGETLKKSMINDKVIISYSGHGLLSKNLYYFLSTYDINFKHPAQNGLAYENLEVLLNTGFARKKLLLIDACHSGEVDKEAANRMKVVFSDTSSSLKQGSKSGIELLVDEPIVGLKNSFELMQELFVNVGKGSGATIISAAAGTQVAYEKGALKNGVFTYCILQMLKNQPHCTVQQLKEYVGTEVEKLTNGLQKPTTRNEVIGFDWQVW